MNSTDFHAAFDREVHNLTEPTRDHLLESSGECSREEIIGQLMMDNLFPHPCDPEVGDYGGVFTGKLTRKQKVTLIGVAEHMGPDWCQALYHAVVFMTKVA